MGPRATTLVDLVRERASASPEATAYTFLADGEGQEESLTCAGLERRARAVAAALREAGVAPGERALLLLPPGLDYVAAFFGSLFAGVVAVPVYAPHPTHLLRALGRLRAIAASARPSAVLTGTAYLPGVEAHFGGDALLRGLRPLAVDGAARADAPGAPAEVGAHTLAFLQYTSGSTSEPKGVMVTHANLLANLELIRMQFGVGPRSHAVLWLPPYHDMGLIGGVLEPLYAGFPVTLMSPVHFLQRPARWLEAIARTRASVSGGPNFAYELCLRKLSPEQRAALDLSGWELAFNGAEPVRAETLERFAAAFAVSGFRPRAFRPCYGLAEATLLVAAGEPGAEPALRGFEALALEQDRALEAPAGEGRRLVGCGSAPRGQRVAVVDPHALAPCAPGRVGEIWVQGASVAQGYWGRPEESERTFGARLASGDGPFLRTGDLGFEHGGELFVTGRLKDLIVVRGRNLYPQDVEATAGRAHPALRPGGGAAFAVEAGGEERLVVVHELDRPQRGAALGEPIAAVRQAVAEEHEAPLHAVALIAAGALPKTSSGKVRRQACRRLFLEGGLETLALWREPLDGEPPAPDVSAAGLAAAPEEAGPGPLAAEPRTAPGEALEAWLAARLAEQARVEARAIDPDAPLTRYGLDSLAAVELAHAIERGLGRVVPMDALLRGASLRELAAELRAPIEAGAPAPPSAPAPQGLAPGGEAPLSHGQRALWFLHQLDPLSPAYNVARAARLTGELDVDALLRALGALVERHPALRTTYAATPAGPVQRVGAGAAPAFAVEDASEWSEAALGERLAAEARRPFDLERGPVVRFTLLRRGPAEHVLLLAVHHIAVDFWSLAVLVDELGRLYPALRAGRDAGLEPPPAGYAEFARWQQQLVDGPEGGRLWEFWRAKLQDAPTLELPADRPRPKRPSHAGATRAFALDAALTARLRALAADEGVTLHTLLLAAFQALLHRYTGQDDFVVGTPVAGRSRAAWAGSVGYFVNVLPLRADLGGDPGFRAFLRRARASMLEAFAHEDYPLPLLVERLQPARDPGRSPLFDAVFVLQKAHRLDAAGLAAFAVGQGGGRLDLGGVALEPAALAQGGAQFDLTLTMAESEGRLAGAFEYATDLFEAGTIDRLAGHFETLLAGLAERPDARLSELPLLTPRERRVLVGDWASPAGAPAPAASIPALFERRAARAPESPALESEGERLSYAELNRRANRLARRLRARGVGPDACVGLLLERSIELIVCQLAVLKAGGAYLPLDPSFPAERLAFMLADTRARLLLARGAAARRPSVPGVETLDLDHLEAAAAAESDADPTPLAGPEHLAYVMYTSGSTGRPKGIGVPHRGVVRLVCGTDYARFGSDQTFLHFAPPAFDAATFEVWGALLHGARLAVAPARAAGLDDLARLVERHAVTTLWLTAGLFHVLADGPVERLGSLRQLLAGGDALSPAQVRRAAERLPGCRLINGYGPTENTTFTCTHAVTDAAALDGSVPIGRPIPGTRVYVLDPRLEPVPAGVAGELWAAGDGLARGYVGRPDLTAERFLADPHAQRPGARMYRTGDRARWRADGTLEFLGRLDRQVKVRGFRVEPGEIESALGAHPEVKTCAVAVSGDGATEKRLVAYVVASASPPPAAAALRAFLAERLPEPLLPSAVVFLEALPLTPNGKVDRRALPAPGPAGGEAAFVAPRDVIEDVLARLWAEVLGVERVSVRDGFFELGGHSLLATQLVNRVRRTFQVELPLRSLFERPTVEGLAAALVAGEGRPGRVEKIARAVKRMQSLSPEEAQRLLERRRARHEVSLEA